MIACHPARKRPTQLITVVQLSHFFTVQLSRNNDDYLQLVRDVGAPAFYSTVSQHVEKSVQNVTTSYESEYANVPVSQLPDDSSSNILLDRIR